MWVSFGCELGAVFRDGLLLEVECSDCGLSGLVICCGFDLVTSVCWFWVWLMCFGGLVFLCLI